MGLQQGLETTTFHILTPYPGTRLHRRFLAEGRILHDDWDLYDTRHAVFSHLRMSAETIENGYWRSYETYYKWSSLFRAARTKTIPHDFLRHLLYVAAWKKFDPVWSLIIKLRKLDLALPSLERVLEGRGNKARRDTSLMPATNEDSK